MNINKFISPILLTAILLISPFTLAAEPHPELHLNEAEQAWIAAHPTLRVANEMDWPPFDYMENGQAKGYSIDLIRVVAEKAGFQPQFVNGFTWAELLEKFQAGEIDIMPAIYVNDERKKFTAFTQGYFSQPSVIVIEKNNEDITDISSLAGKRIAGIPGFAITRALKTSVPDITLVPVVNALEGIKAVSLGKADAFIESIGIVSYTLENNFIPNIKTITQVDLESVSNPELHMGFGQDNPVLGRILDKALQAISREEKHELYNRWFLLPVDGDKMELSPEQQAWINAHPAIRVGIDSDYAPYSFLDKNGNFVGVAPDFIRLISRKLGLKIEPVPDLSWPQIVEGARTRSLDVIATAVITKERRQFLNFTPIYIPTPLVIMTRENKNEIKHPDDLEGRTIALVKGYSSTQRILEEHPGIKPYEVDKPIDGLKAVALGQADAYVGTLGVNVYLTRKSGITNLKIAGSYDLDTNGQRFAVRSDWPELTLLLNQALESIDEEERTQIFDRWISVPYENQVDYSPLWQALATLSVIIVLLYIYIRKLAGEVRRRKTVELELKKVNETLFEAKESADHANKAKSEFLSSMSHELRTPMNAILGFGQLLEKSLQNVQNRQNVNEILNAGHHLLELIDEVLDLSRVESGNFKLSMESISLSLALDECFALIDPLAAKHKIRVINRITQNSDILVDSVRFKQILLNLLSNAVKYNREDGSITLRCETTDPQHLRISISDTGPGLTEEQRQHLFKPFERMGAECTDIEGTGIGLVISKRLIEMMGGRIGMESQPGLGCTFWIDVPLAIDPAPTPPPRSPSPTPQDRTEAETSPIGRIILHIEDNPANRKLVEQIIKLKTPHSLIAAPNGFLGLELAETHQPDLILLDINMPQMNGYEVMERLQSHESTRHIPVIGLSANAMASDLQRSRQVGFMEYMTKPINIEQLLTHIDKVITAKG